MSTACASSVFLLSLRNRVLNQSAHIFALGYFRNSNINDSILDDVQIFVNVELILILIGPS